MIFAVLDGRLIVGYNFTLIFSSTRSRNWKWYSDVGLFFWFPDRVALAWNRSTSNDKEVWYTEFKNRYFAILWQGATVHPKF